MATRVETFGRRRLRAASSSFDRHIRLWLIAPAVLIILALTIFPLAFSLWVSFVEFDFSVSNEHPWVGLDNFRDNWRDPVWIHSLKVTAILATASVVVELAIGFLLALAMLRPFRGRRPLMTLFVLPLFMSPVIVGGFFDLFLRRPFGPMNWLLNQIPWMGDVSIDFTNDFPWTFISLIIADAWQWTPFMFVILLAGLSSISDELYEAAEIDGAKPRQSFFFVTLPLLMPIVLIALTFRFIDAAKLFDIIYSLTRGGPGTDTYTSSYYLYQQGFEFFHLGQGTAGSWMFLVFLTVISFWLVRRLLKPLEA
ncbi:MAG: sugar ABC transporter permease [Actinobacteria bacterium]|nr:sugar ABC transporter permease [Actinomycetota bacterium]